MSFAYSSDDAIRLTTLQTNLLEVEKEAQKVRGKKVILVIGPTGSGKSTAINYLQGRKMEEVINTASDSYFIKVSEDDSIGTTIPSPRIGFGSSSETKFPALYPCGEEYMLCDTAGLLDTHGIESGLTNHVAIDLIVRYAASIEGIIVVTDFNSVKTTRGNSFKTLVNFLNHFTSNASLLEKSVSYLFTRVKSTLSYGQYLDADTIIHNLCETASTLPESDKQLIEGIIRITKSPAVWPLSCLDSMPQEEILRLYRDGEHKIPQEYFNLSLPSTEKALLIELMSKTAKVFIERWQNYGQLQAENITAQREVSANTLKIESLNPLIASIRTLHRLQLELNSMPAKVTKTGTRKVWDGKAGRVFNSKKTVSYSYEETNPAIAAKQAEIANHLAVHPELAKYDTHEKSDQAITENLFQLATLFASNAEHERKIADNKVKLPAIREQLISKQATYQLLIQLNKFFGLAAENDDINRFTTAYKAYSSTIINTSEESTSATEEDPTVEVRFATALSIANAGAGAGAGAASMPSFG